MKKRIFWTALTGLYILFIFSNSLKTSDLSSADSGHVLRLVQNLLTSTGLEGKWLSEHIIRKAGHFTEYTGLGLILYQCVRSYEFGAERRLYLHGLAGFMVPFFDETIQLFVAGRSGQISDVWLDCSGVAAGSLIAALLIFISVRMEHSYGKKLPDHNGI